ncbi:MAG: chemotaxis protein CheA [bacterium]|nr:chemotaxis protein CheA [bacterium]
MSSDNNNNGSGELDLDIFDGMSDEEINDLLEVFYEDLSGRVESLSDLVLKLEEEPENENTVNAIFQEFHSIKGTGGTFGFPVLSDIAHKLESILSDIRDKKAAVTPELIDMLLDAAPMLKDIIVKIRERNAFEEPEKAIFHLLDTFAISEPVKQPESKPEQKVSPEPAREDVDFIELVKLRPEKIDKLIALSSELLRRQHIDSQQLGGLQEIIKLLRNNNMKLRSKLERFIISSDVKDEESADVLRSLLNNYDDCRRDLSGLLNESETWKDIFANQINELQFEVLKTRMVMVDELFRKIKRTVRDILKTEKKKVQVSFTGGETEIDKILMEEINDPMVHIIRNSIDHGIELPEERKKLGKEPVASIKVSAIPAGNEIQIKIQDDGKGLDLEKIKKTAVEKGFLKKSELEKLDRQQLIDLIFRPGFSTTKKVTKISGRGVGMDVVKSRLDRIRGVIQIDTAKGMGSTFLLKIPLTLATIKALFFRVGIFHFYIQSIAVEKIIRISQEESKPKGRVEEVLINNNPIPFVYLGDILGIPETEPEFKKGTYVIVIRSGARRMAIEVDDCIDQHDVVLKPKADLIRNVDIVAGVSVLPDGKVAYVIEPSEIFNKCDKIFSNIDNKKTWDIDLVDRDLPDFTDRDEGVKYNVEEKDSRGLYLHFVKGKKHYGIPLDNIQNVFNLADKELALRIEKKYRSILHLKDNTAKLILRQEYKSPLNLIERTGVKSAVVVRKNEENSLILTDDLLNIDVLDRSDLKIIEKTGNNIDDIPDIVMI